MCTNRTVFKDLGAILYPPKKKVQHSEQRHEILVNDQLDALFLNVFISCLYMFRAQVLIIRRAKLY
jgi:hypothetical protein